MANIVEFKKGNTYHLSERSGKPTNVNCIYEKQILLDGSIMIVIKTYNPNSKNGSISQTIHFTKDTAIKLIDIFKKEFPI